MMTSQDSFMEYVIFCVALFHPFGGKYEWYEYLPDIQLMVF